MSNLNIEVIPLREEFFPRFNNEMKRSVEKEKLQASSDVLVKNRKQLHIKEL